MNALIFALSAVLPIIIMVAIGYAMKRMGIVNVGFAKIVNRLVFRIFLPVMLFLNVYKIGSISNIRLGYIFYGAAAVLVIFFISTPLVMLVTKHNDRRGPLLQGIFRSNYALVGIPLTQALFGQSGLASATLLSAVSIPVFNVLAVISLTVFKDNSQGFSLKKILKGIVKNPLIQSIFAGLCVLVIRRIYVEYGISFRLSHITPLYTVLGYLSGLATPLALLMLGVEFDFSQVKGLKKEIIFGSLMRTAVVPVLGLGAAYIFFRNSFDGAQFAALVALFATPVAVSSVPMAQEMGADTTLSGQLVVWTTVLSAVAIFVAAFLFKAVGIF